MTLATQQKGHSTTGLIRKLARAIAKFCLSLRGFQNSEKPRNTVYIGFCDSGFSGQSGYSDRHPLDGAPLLHDSDLGCNDLQFCLLCSEIATVNTFGGRYTQQSVVYIGFSDHLVVKPSENPLNLATTIGFYDLDLCDEGWSQNPMYSPLSNTRLLRNNRPVGVEG